MATDPASYGYELTVDEKDRFVYRREQRGGEDVEVLEGVRDPQTGGWDVRYYAEMAGYGPTGVVADGVVVGGSMGKQGAKRAALHAMKEQASGESLGNRSGGYGEFGRF